MNAKNDLQEFMVKRKLPVPIYNSIIVGGPQHQPKWQSTVTLSDGNHFQGEIVLSKTQAEITAAEAVLAYLKSNLKPASEPEMQILPRFKSLPSSPVSELKSMLLHQSTPAAKPAIAANTMRSLDQNARGIERNSSKDPVGIFTKMIPPSKSLPVLKVSDLSESVSESPTIERKVYSVRTVLLVDLENLPKLAEEALELTKDLDIYIFVGMHHCLAPREYPDRIKKIISPSTRPDGTDTCLQVYVGYLLTIQAYDSYLIGTRDHYGSALVEMITHPVLPWMKKEARLVTHVSQL